MAAAKAAVDAMTRTLAVEWGPRGVRVNAIAPGPIGDTEGARRLFPGELADRLRSMIPTRRIGAIDDIVNLALFVLSDAGSNLNGAILVSDGGLCLTRPLRPRSRHGRGCLRDESIRRPIRMENGTALARPQPDRVVVSTAEGIGRTMAWHRCHAGIRRGTSMRTESH